MGTTNIEFFNLLSAFLLHISQEGGSVIARHFLSTKKSMVLFGPTDEKFYGFDENENISCRKCNCPCEWLMNDWMYTCPLGKKDDDCMNSITVSNLYSRIVR